MVRLPVDSLLQEEFRFLLDEAGFTVLTADKNEAQLANGDIRISLRHDWKDGGFAVLIWREGQLDRFYPLTDYADFFEGKRTRHVRDIPPAARQAVQLNKYLPRILRMLHAAPDSEDWMAYHVFFTRW